MAFAPIFQRPFSATFDRRAAAAASWWLEGGVAAANAIAVYQPKGAASLAASYDNIAAPGNGLADGTYDAAPGVAPTFDAATGWTFNGINQYLTTGVTATVSHSMLVRFSSASGTQQAILIGTLTAGARFWFKPLYFGPSLSYGWGSSEFIATPNITSGVLGLTADAGYKNGIPVVAVTGSFAGSTTELFIGCGSFGITPANYISSEVQAAAIYDTILTAPQVALISAAMAAL